MYLNTTGASLEERSVLLSPVLEMSQSCVFIYYQTSVSAGAKMQLYAKTLQDQKTELGSVTTFNNLWVAYRFVFDYLELF